MSAIGAIGSYGSIGGYYSIYQNKGGFQNRNTNPASMDPVSPVSRAQTTPVPPVNRVSAVHRGASPAVPEEESQFPTMREGADPAEMAVRARIKYLGDEELQNTVKLPWENADELKAGQAKDDSKSPREVMEESECQTCKNRKYQDGSDEMVSFKSAAHISPSASASRVRAHEQEHVNNAYTKAAQNNGKVLSASVALKSAICPECGRSYVAGGTTTTQIKYQDESNPYTKNKKSQDAISLIGNHLDIAV